MVRRAYWLGNIVSLAIRISEDNCCIVTDIHCALRHHSNTHGNERENTTTSFSVRNGSKTNSFKLIKNVEDKFLNMRCLIFDEINISGGRIWWKVLDEVHDCDQTLPANPREVLKLSHGDPDD